MAASSPYRNNDYAATDNFRPYNLPVNDIFRGLQAQDQFWKIGAEREKRVYDSALDLQLSLAPNQEIRDKFMQDADKELTKLSAKDLSKAAIQREGFNIFKPLFQDEGIVSDDAATRHIGKVQQDIRDARTNKNGQFYHPNNAMYALDGVNEFKNSTDRMAGKEYLSKAKEYEPYYDASPELNTILKNCKPEEYSRDVENGLDIVNYSSKALSSVRLSGCIQSGISDKAKRQLQIDGYVTYKNNPRALRDAYLPLIDNTREQLEQQNAAYSGILANKDKLPSLSDEQLKKIGLSKDTIKEVTPELITSFDKKVKENQLRLDNINKTYNQLTAGDFSSISGENLEPVASMVYTKGYADNFAAAFSYNPPESIKVKPHESQMLIYREGREDMRQEDQQNFLIKMEEAKAEDARQLQLLKNLAVKGKGSNGQLTTEDILNRTNLKSAFIGDVAESDSYDKITARRNDIATERATLNDYALSQLKLIPGFTDAVKDSDFRATNGTFQNWYTNFTKSLPKGDPFWGVIKDYENKMNRLIMQEDLLKNNQDEIDKIADKEVKLPQTSNYVATLDMGNGVVLHKSPADVIKDIRSGVARVSDSDFADAIGLSDFIPGEHGKALIYKIGGKDYRISTDNIRNSSKSLKLINDVTDYGKAITSKRNELASTKTIVQKEGYSFPELDAFDPKNPDSFKGRIMKTVGIPDAYEKAITIGDTDLRGGVEITIHPDTKNNPDYSERDILDEFKKKYGDNIHDIPGGNKYHFIVSGFNEVNKFNSSEMQGAELMLPYVRSMESKVDNAHPQSTQLLRSSTPHKMYGMMITTSSTPGTFMYKVYDESNKTLGIYPDRIAALQILNAALEGRWNDEKVK